MDPDGTRLVAEALGMDYRYTARASHPATGQPFGNAVLSPWPMSDAVEVPLPHTAAIQGQPRAATAVEVQVDDRPLLTYSVHLETVLLDLRRRRRQLLEVARDIERQSSERVIVAGDFNSASSRSIRSFDRCLSPTGLHRLTPADHATFHRFGRSFALDHIYARGLEPKDVGVVANASASDHQPVWADVDER